MKVFSNPNNREEINAHRTGRQWFNIYSGHSFWDPERGRPRQTNQGRLDCRVDCGIFYPVWFDLNDAEACEVYERIIFQKSHGNIADETDIDDCQDYSVTSTPCLRLVRILYSITNTTEIEDFILAFHKTGDAIKQYRSLVYPDHDHLEHQDNWFRDMEARYVKSKDFQEKFLKYFNAIRAQVVKIGKDRLQSCFNWLGLDACTFKCPTCRVPVTTEDRLIVFVERGWEHLLDQEERYHALSLFDGQRTRLPPLVRLVIHKRFHDYRVCSPSDRPTHVPREDSSLHSPDPMGDANMVDVLNFLEDAARDERAAKKARLDKSNPKMATEKAKAGYASDDDTPPVPSSVGCNVDDSSVGSFSDCSLYDEDVANSTGDSFSADGRPPASTNDVATKEPSSDMSEIETKAKKMAEKANTGYESDDTSSVMSHYSLSVDVEVDDRSDGSYNDDEPPTSTNDVAKRKRRADQAKVINKHTGGPEFPNTLIMGMWQYRPRVCNDQILGEWDSPFPY